MKPWREVIIPNPDVLQGTFKQSEFAADITAVHTGEATRVYQEAETFFQRTFITEGMALLLISIMQRLNGKGGDPVIQLQTVFGGGKTHTMLAVYHLAARTCSLADLPGIPALMDRAGVMDIPKARIVVLDGTAHAPGQAWSHGTQTINTLWGEVAWQLGGEEGYAKVRDSDQTGMSPGKEVLKNLLSAYAPCVILIDELVAYIRQFPEEKLLSGGSYDSNLSFIQALTEGIKLVPSAVMLASLPESEVEAGSHQGVATLRALEKTFGRVHALWKPVAIEEAFEIVRRRLFESVHDIQARDTVCRSFAEAYRTEGARMPSETQESRYYDRLIQAYPVHPEFFDRLYEDWTTLQGFQRTRGVLKLMAKAIHRLWKDENQDLMIMPGSLPLYDGDSRNELTYYLEVGWDAVLEKDIDGERAETTELEAREPRFGTCNAARRVARTIFLGSAPAAVGAQKGIRGLDRAHILLGCIQPGHSSSVFSDALDRLADRLHYLNSSGEKQQDATRFWFDTRANLRREMEDRKGRFDDTTDVRGKIAEMVRKLATGTTFFDAVHPFTPHGDVPDDGALRLVLLPPEKFYSRQDGRLAIDEVLEYIRNNGTRPRYRGNRLLFLAPEFSALGRLRDCVRTVLAWNSIIEDVSCGRLNIDRLQEQQARKELSSIENVLPRVTRECYKWLLCPVQNDPADRQSMVEAFSINTSGDACNTEIERVCRENELVIERWAAIHLRDILRRFYWKPDNPEMKAMSFWEDTQRYLYLPRLKNRATLENVISQGTESRDFFGVALGKTSTSYEGFSFGKAISHCDSELLLIEPGVAEHYARKLLEEEQAKTGPAGGGTSTPAHVQTTPAVTIASPVSGGTAPQTVAVKVKSFHGAIDVKAGAAKMHLSEVADEIISVLASDPQAKLEITVEIHADFPAGAADHIKRAVSENANSLGFKISEWE